MVKSRMVDGGLPPALPSTIRSTLGRVFFTSLDESAGVLPRSLAEVRRSGPVFERIWENSGCFGRRMPIVLKLLK